MDANVVRNLINKKEELAAKGISIIEANGYTKLYYNMLKADFYDEETCYCRGITFRGKKIVCCPFFKFGNYGEGYVPDIDWASARVLEKLDGSLIMLWNDEGAWHVSTSKTIDAFMAPLGQLTLTTFGDLFFEAAHAQGLNFQNLNPNFTYMFELTSPYNKIVVPYEKAEIWHIGTRDNYSLQEVEVDIGVQKPKAYPVNTLSECVAAAAALEGIKEGFVVVDKFYNRIKVKTPLYVQLHHTHNNGNLSVEDLFALIFANETEEYLTYFPEKSGLIHEAQKKLEKLCEAMESEWKYVKAKVSNLERKAAAEIIRGMIIPDFGFTNKYKQSISAWNYLQKMSTKKLLNLVEEM